MYITTPGTARKLAAVAQRTRFFWIDDVWVTGYLARELGIQQQDIWVTRRAEAGVLVYKSIQNPFLYHREFTSDPMDWNNSLSMALYRRARWCYLNKCLNH